MVYKRGGGGGHQCGQDNEVYSKTKQDYFSDSTDRYIYIYIFFSMHICILIYDF